MYADKNILRMGHSAGGYGKRLHRNAEAINIYMGYQYRLQSCNVVKFIPIVTGICKVKPINTITYIWSESSIIQAND